MKKAILFSTVFLSIVLSVFGQGDERRVALVIGNGEYAYNTALRNPANDAWDMAEALRECGFETTVLVNAGRTDMEKAIRDFGAALKDPNAVGLFYYSGHGAQTDGQSYLLPVDADIQEADELRYKAVDGESVLAKMRSSGSKLNIVVFDACRNNPFPGSSRASERGLAAVRVKVPESLIVYATDPGATASDGEGRNSPFTRAFLSQMKTPGQDISLMMKRVTSTVRAETKGAQTPWVSSNLTVDFEFRHLSDVSPVAAVNGSMAVGEVYGSLRIDVMSSCRVFVDGDDKGSIQASGVGIVSGVRTGVRTVEVRYGDGRTESESIRVEPNQQTSVSFSYVAMSKLSANFVPVNGGTFLMGSESGGMDEKPVHTVSLSSFLMSRYEVTFDEYDAFCDATGRVKPSDEGWGRGDRPVINVSWYDAVEYCIWLSLREGLSPCYTIDKTREDPSNPGTLDTLRWTVDCNFSANGYRLPTEAEWEYAARGGNRSDGYEFAGSRMVSDVGWFTGNAEGKTQPVGGKRANELGLFDMSGNVWEWCWDRYGRYPGEAQTDPVGPTSGAARIRRGGSWYITASYCSVYHRYYDLPSNKNYFLGFRVISR